MADIMSTVMCSVLAKYDTTGANSGGAVNGAAKDLSASLPRSVGMMVYVGRFDTGGGAKTVDVKLQSSPDNSTWTDVPNGAITQLLSAGGAGQTARIDAKLETRYIRAVYTVGGTFGATDLVNLLVVLIAGDAARQPVTQV